MKEKDKDLLKKYTFIVNPFVINEKRCPDCGGVLLGCADTKEMDEVWFCEGCKNVWEIRPKTTR